MLCRISDGVERIPGVSHDLFVRPVIFHYIAIHCVSSASQPGQSYEKIVVIVSWLSSLRDRFCLVKPLQSWCSNDFLPGGVHSFILAESLCDLCAFVHIK